MESLARRGVRTTVAVAGLAALGVGLAAPRVRRPDVPDGERDRQRPRRPTGQPAGASSQFSNASGALGELPAPFTFAMPAAAAGRADRRDARGGSAPSDSPSTEAASSESPASSAPGPGRDDARRRPPSTPSTGALPGLPALPPVAAAGQPQVPNVDPAAHCRPRRRSTF